MTDEPGGAEHMAVPDDYPIPPQLRNDRFRFIKVDKGDRPEADEKQRFKKAIEKDWPDTRNYAWDHPEIVGWIMFGGNYGVMPRGEISIIDLDDMSAKDALKVVEGLGETFAVRTGSGKGLHVYVECDAVQDKFHFTARPPERFHGDFYNPGCRAFVVGPGCRHWSGGTYEVIRDLPIARVAPERFRAAFLDRLDYAEAPKPLPPTVSPGREIRASLTDQLGLRIEDFAMPLDPQWTGDQWQGTHPLHDSSTGANFTVSPSKNAFFCHRHKVGGDPVSWIVLLANPGMACDALKRGGVTPERFQQVVDYLWYRGYAERLSALGHRASASDDTPPPPAPLGPDGQPVATDGTPLWAPPATAVAPPAPGAPDLADIADLIVKPHPTLQVNLEPDHFISRYMKWAGSKTDALHEYHFAGAITLLSLTAQRCAMMCLDQEQITPCVWTFWIGQSSTSRKSTSIKFVKTILEGQHEIVNSSELDTDFTPESFIEAMADRPRSYLIRDEAAGLLAKLKKPYMGGMRDTFCQAYDGNTISKRLTKKAKGQENVFRVPNPYLTSLLATTPDSFEKESDYENLTSGWFYRYLWIWPNRDKPHRRPLRMEDPAKRAEMFALREWTRRLFMFFASRRNHNGGDDEPILFSISEAQFERYDAWVAKHEATFSDESNDQKANMFSRLQIYVLKLAMLFVIGQPDADKMMDRAIDPIPVPDRYLDEAMQMVETCFMPVVFDVYDRVDLASSDNDQKRILKALAQRGGKMPRRDLMKRVRLKKRDFDDAIAQLIDDTGEVVEYEKRTSAGHPQKWYALRREEPR